MTGEDLRAGVLLVVIGVHLFAAAPLARTADRKALDLPLAVDEYARIRHTLDAFGLHFSHAQLADAGFAVAQAEVGLRRIVLRPLQPWFRLTGTGQAWGLFTYPDRFPARLVVEGRHTGGKWRRLYASLDADADFAAEKFVYRRVRGVYDGNSEKAGSGYDPFCSWAAREVFAGFADIDEARVSFQRQRTWEPGESPTAVEPGAYHSRRVRFRQ